MQSHDTKTNEQTSKAAAYASKAGSSLIPPSKGITVQARLSINRADDSYEQEADRVADQVLSMTSPLIQTKPFSISALQRKCAHCEAEEKEVHRKEFNSREAVADSDLERYVGNLSGGGQPLPGEVQGYFSPRFGYDFQDVRIHTDSIAAKSSQSINALAYTSGNNIVFNENQYSPGTDSGKKLLAHELTHVVQQSSNIQSRKIQRTIGDGHDLTAPVFTGDAELEAAFDNERVIQLHSKGAHVRKLQQSLLEMGYNLPDGGVDGDFGPETKAAIERFQRDAGAVHVDGEVGPETMRLFDEHDTSGTAGPLALVGPLPGPRPASDCNDNFTGVTFALANQVATPATPAARMRIVSQGGVDVFVMQSTAVANYRPQITITAPTNAKAQEFEVGFVQNLLSENLVYTYSNGTSVRSLMPTPIKDGLARTAVAGGGGYNALFVQDRAATIVEAFTATGDTRSLIWPDTPSDSSPVNLNDTPECGAGAPAVPMSNAIFNDRFRVWVVVRHVPSGCVRSLHHIDWQLNLEANILTVLGAHVPAPVHNEILINQANGDGTPGFIQGGAVANDFTGNRACV